MYDVVINNNVDFRGFWQLVTSEKGNWVKIKCRVSLTYAVYMDGIETTVIDSGDAGDEIIPNYRQPVIAHKSIH